ncbi:ActS/PrrB/RegB family redox-sensitive histidine kinase [Pelagibacterales bacterium SAG-MED24]|nr:ActS/PrrB/RegB family redox-sensitive histidine kinase [Pelagibacterales bacterium SAG-MED24]MBD1153589.1 ActS/PrrB/RegB family redox-sensitive histidine kinase [Pelagibacterales bacterium SAG-MED23]
MELSSNSKSSHLNKITYVNLRWIGIIGQFITINSVAFIFQFEFSFLLANFIVLIGALSNFFLFYYFKKNQLPEKISLTFLTLDILQLSFLLYLTGGTINPFSIFLIIPSIFASNSLNIKTNILLISLTISSIILLTFFHQELPFPLNEYIFSDHYYYSVPLALVIALIFLSFFALTFGKESRVRKDALDKIQEVISKEQELVSLGGQAAAAAHSLGTPLSTIKIISQDLFNNFKDNKDLKKDIELLVSQVDRCNIILKKLSLNPIVEDDFIDKDISLHSYVKEIVNSFQEISKKNFVINTEQNYNSFEISKSIEIVYGIRNFIGNANKFSNKNVYISITSNSENSSISIEDDGSGFTKDIISKIGEPYIKSLKSENKSRSGLGLGIFIGKTLLEKNYAKLLIRNSETRGGAEVKIEWANKDLKNI